MLDELELLAALHDIGKIAIPNELLEKEKELLKKEWSRVRRHSEIGYRIALSTPQISKIADAILYHHEWWNGKGYPQGIKGEEIPMTTRIIAIIDACDVMRNGRSYKEKMDPGEVLAELKKKSRTQFDPVLVRKFITLIQEDPLLLDSSNQ